MESILLPHTHKASSVCCFFLCQHSVPRGRLGGFGGHRDVIHPLVVHVHTSVLYSGHSHTPHTSSAASQSANRHTHTMHSVGKWGPLLGLKYSCVCQACSQRRGGMRGVWAWKRDSSVCSAASSTACCCMLACPPQNEPLPQEEDGLYEYTAERSDLPIRPRLSKLSTPQRRCYYTPQDSQQVLTSQERALAPALWYPSGLTLALCVCQVPEIFHMCTPDPKPKELLLWSHNMNKWIRISMWKLKEFISPYRWTMFGYAIKHLESHSETHYFLI